MPASFVYQKGRKKTREGADICEVKCKRLACEIQVCISKVPLTKSKVSASVLDHGKCQPDIDRYNRCNTAKKALARQEARGIRKRTRASPDLPRHSSGPVRDDMSSIMSPSVVVSVSPRHRGVADAALGQ